MRRCSRLFWALLPLTLVALATPAASSSEPSHRRSMHAPASIHVSSATVLCLAQKGVQPSGKPVPAKGKRPAGVAVFGVAGLGIGVREGDVVTEILGQPVRSAAQGVGLIIAARAARRPVITGTLWRDARAIGVTVEQPYTMPDCDPREAECWKSQCLDDRAAKPKARRSKTASSGAK